MAQVHTTRHRGRFITIYSLTIDRRLKGFIASPLNFKGANLVKYQKAKKSLQGLYFNIAGYRAFTQYRRLKGFIASPLNFKGANLVKYQKAKKSLQGLYFNGRGNGAFIYLKLIYNRVILVKCLGITFNNVH